MFVRPRHPHSVVRIDALCFPAGSRKRRLGSVCLISWHVFIVLLFIRALLYVSLVFIGMCSVFVMLQKNITRNVTSYSKL